MARLNWNATGERIYEAGVDRGVFYPLVGPGIPWNGLISIEETPDASQNVTYVDGVPYRTQKTRENFAAALKAYTVPREFEDYDLVPGEQRGKAFGLSYRTLIGNDISADHGSKIHLVYNVIATQKPMDIQSLNNDNQSASLLEWSLSAKPVRYPGLKPAAHFILDTSIAYPWAVKDVEDFLYGSESAEARFPTIEELVNLVERNSILLIIDHGDGTWTASGPDDVVSMIDDTTFEINWPSVQYLDSETYVVESL